MKPYEQDVFYGGTSISENMLEEFKKETVNKAYKITLEQKYRNNVSHREPTDKSLEWILGNIDGFDNYYSHVKCVHRKPNFNIEERFEVVYHYSPREWYFAWCDIDLKHKEYFIQKYGLKEL